MWNEHEPAQLQQVIDQHYDARAVMCAFMPKEAVQLDLVWILSSGWMRKDSSARGELPLPPPPRRLMPPSRKRAKATTQLSKQNSANSKRKRKPGSSGEQKVVRREDGSIRKLRSSMEDDDDNAFATGVSSEAEEDSGSSHPSLLNLDA